MRHMNEPVVHTRLALRIADLAKSHAIAKLPFLSAATGKLRVEPGLTDSSFGTDGQALFVNSERVLEAFAERGHIPKEEYLHLLLHCIFLHPFVHTDIVRKHWNLACDIVCEKHLIELGAGRGGTRGELIEEALERVLSEVPAPLTAEKIYRSFENGKNTRFVDSWCSLFFSDDHGPWYVRSQTKDADTVGTDSNEDSSACTGGASEGRRGGSGITGKDDLKAEWTRTGKTVAMSLRTMMRSQGDEEGGFVVGLEEVARERVDYRDFLRRFAVMGEQIKLSDDEFDYIFYTYGIKLYGNMPLVEPLEYAETKRIREFVLVIDTSASVYGPAVQQFVTTTFDILKASESYFERVHIRILQCDTEVQSDDRITSLSELDAWKETFELHGFGGTDFRPAFAYVDGLIENRVLTNLGGLIYFTDGWGVYPQRPPKYRTAFVFYDEYYRTEVVPPWAVQIVLNSGDM